MKRGYFTALLSFDSHSTPQDGGSSTIKSRRRERSRVVVVVNKCIYGTSTAPAGDFKDHFLLLLYRSRSWFQPWSGKGALLGPFSRRSSRGPSGVCSARTVWPDQNTVPRPICSDIYVPNILPNLIKRRMVYKKTALPSSCRK